MVLCYLLPFFFFFFPGNDPIAEEVETEKLELLKMKLFLGDPLPPSVSLDITLLGGQETEVQYFAFCCKNRMSNCKRRNVTKERIFLEEEKLVTRRHREEFPSPLLSVHGIESFALG